MKVGVPLLTYFLGGQFSSTQHRFLLSSKIGPFLGAGFKDIIFFYREKWTQKGSLKKKGPCVTLFFDVFCLKSLLSSKSLLMNVLFFQLKKQYIHKKAFCSKKGYVVGLFLR